MANYTPLRYPGGKACLRPYVERLIACNDLHDAHYVEPFCGGAGLALDLLSNSVVSAIHLNDLDRSIFAFWQSAVHDTDRLCALIEDTPCSMDTWHGMKAIRERAADAEILELGFATFFLNRTNRSGILDAGVIGGKRQDGKWKIDARYNRVDLLRRIQSIGKFRSRIHLSNLEATSFLTEVQPKLPTEALIYLDPPYVEKGPGLYMNHYQEEDHRALAAWISSNLDSPWIVSYDAHPLIAECYSNYTSVPLSLAYSAYGNAKRGDELMFFSPQLTPPKMQNDRSKYLKPWAADALNLV